MFSERHQVGGEGSRRARRRPSRAAAGLLAAVVLLIGATGTALGVQAERRSVAERDERALSDQVRSRAGQLADAVHDAVQVLQATASFQAENGDDMAAFVDFTSRLPLDANPGLSYISYIVPASMTEVSDLEAARRADGQPTFTVAPGPVDERLHVIVFSGPNPESTDGVDVGRISMLATALDEAADSGLPVVTDPFVRIQDRSLPTADQWLSVALYVPVYEAGAATATVEQRRRALLGWTASAVPVQSIMSALGIGQGDPVRVTVHDADNPGVDVAAAPAATPSDGAPRAVTEIDVLNQRWLVEAAALPSFDHAGSSAVAVGIAGSAASLAVAALVLNLALERRRFSITSREALAQAETTESRYRAMVDHAPVGVLLVDHNGEVLDWNATMAHMLGRDPLERPSLVDAVLPEDRPAWSADMDHFRHGDSGHIAADRQMRRADGSTFWARTTAAALPNEDAVVALVQDITAERRAAEAAEELRSRRARYEALVRHSTDLITVIGPDRRIVYASPAISAMVGVSAEDAVGVDPLFPVHTEDYDVMDTALASSMATPGVQEPVSFRIVLADGSVRWIEATATNLLDDPDVRGVVANCRDVTAYHEAAESLRRRADHDALTGVATRDVLLRKLDGALARARSDGGSVAVLFVDLDRFKQVNDRHGHGAGDALLVEVGARVADAVRPGDMVARHGGDEFVVLLDDVNGEREARGVAERVRAALRLPVVVAEGVVLEPGASVGVALSDGSTTAAAMLRDADAALYRAKATGRDRVEVFDDELRHRAVRRLDTELVLRQALEEDAIRLRFEPVADLVDGDIVGAEGRVHLVLPSADVVPYAELLPVAQDAGLASELTSHLLDAACRATAAWASKSDGARWIGVDVSSSELTHSTFIARLARLLDASGVEAGALRLELPVDVLSQGSNLTRQAIAAARALGVQVVLDGVGAELRSLAALRSLDVDGLKLDLAALPDIVGDPVAAAVAASVGEVAAAASLPVVVVGANESAQLSVVRRLGFRYVQGAAVAPISETVELLAREYRVT